MFTSHLEEFIEEDLGYNDISCTIVPDKTQKAVIFAKENCILAGTGVAKEILDYFGIKYEQLFDDGDFLVAGNTIFELEGSAISILRAERLTLNFLGHLSGIATLTRKCVDLVSRQSKTRIAATRKTTPGLRRYEKLAVIAGGGDPHRFNLSDSIMIKDNHRNMMGLENAILEAQKRASFTQKIEVEVESVSDALIAAKMNVDIIMLDNMEPSEISDTISALQAEGLREHVIIEISGGISPANLNIFADTGADIISMGSLIHKSRWIDISLEVKE
ncbi:carboxylating nicotinate-nucleotide diphosphorylase [Methanohalophilus levihalophilus]|uniref:carboxylating nicotinate-nucleotide diphosphorylase n=1 Tax=Methanohalophilus levihalophilus TaxID=1431282 RepID=UPI001AE3F630|nr:carboxylating nicotinate-nucleotide diphosphorylase [Methanohalophilus levihalophilus]